MLADDSSGEPDVVQVGRLRFHILARSGQHGVRIKDPESPARVSFTGIDYYPTDLRYRKVGRFHPYDEPRQRQVPTVVGIDAPMFIPGEVEIEFDGESYRLLPLVSDPTNTHFFFILRDETSGRGSYGAGRYLYGDLEDGRVVVDFNRAYNPPCAFTPYATCPLPPPENRLPVAIEAGERDYGHHGG